jgi:hypothetical protein
MTAFTTRYMQGVADGEDLLEQLDAGNECPHGRLPGYTGVSCDCWAVLGSVVVLSVPLALREAA